MRQFFELIYLCGALSPILCASVDSKLCGFIVNFIQTGLSTF